MRTSKKFLAMILTILMVVGSFSAVLSSYAFDDVEDYQTQIALMNQLRIVEGKDETTFGYGEDVLRWHMALWIAKIMTGKVDDAYVNWYETTNYTTFQDINPDQFYGSISYGVENGIILGYSESEFGPEDGIKFQDAFTMVVRMLGYGSASMDANYPWSYVDKAIKLGLDDGLRADYNNEEKATREEIVVILYNALFAPRANGTTFGEAKFNLVMDTVVITGTTRGNMFTDAAMPTTKKAAGGDSYVSFNLLNDDGTVQTTPTYYLPRSAFGTLGDDDVAASLKIGYSYDVVTVNDYATVLYAKENDAVVVDQDGFIGGTDLARKDLTINSDAYKAVKSYSSLFSGQGTWTTSDYEAIIYTFQGNDTAIGGSAYLRDLSLNIVDDKGEILLNYIPYAISGISSTVPTGVYMVKKTVGSTEVYVDPTADDWAAAAKAYFKVFPPSTITIYQAITDTYTQITLRNAYSDTILFDDDSNGDYDRGIYVYYSFGKVAATEKDDKVQLTVDGTYLNPGKAYTTTAYIDVDKYFAGEDYVLDPATDVLGQYALYAYNAKLDIFLLKKTYEVKIGYVTTVNKPAKTVTFDQVYFGYNQGNITGSTYAMGVDYLPGGNYNSVVANKSDLDTLKGRTVNYILDEKYSAVLRFIDYGTDVGYVVFKSHINSLNTTGAANVLAFVNSPEASVISIASIDGYTNVTGGQYANSYGPGDLFSATKDALGMYHLTYIPDQKFTYYAQEAKMQYLGLNFTNGVVYNDAQKYVTLSIDPATGKPVSSVAEYYYDNAKGVATKFGNFGVDKDTVILLANGYYYNYLYDGQAGYATNAYNGGYSGQLVNNGSVGTLDFQGSKGIPQDGAHITLAEAFDSYKNMINGARIFVAAPNDDGITPFIYVANGSWDKNYNFNGAGSGTYLDSYDTIIFADENTIATMVATNQTSTGLGVSIGTVYKYTNAIDFIRGGLTSAYTGAQYNQRLYAGHFYYVKNGYVVGEAFVADGNDVQVVNVTYLDKFFSVYANDDVINGNVAINPYITLVGKSIVYELKGTTITYNEPPKDTNTPKDITEDFMKIVNAPNAYASAYVYTGSAYSGQKRVFITTTYTPGSSLKTVVDLGKVLFTNKVSESVNTYLIDQKTYDAISVWLEPYNDSFNTQHSDLGTTMKLYCGDHLISTFNKDNVWLNTAIAQGYGPGNYYLGITSISNVHVYAPCGPACAGNPVYLVWTNRHNTNESYKLDLFEVNVQGGDPLPAVVLYYNIKATLNDIATTSDYKDWTAVTTANGELTCKFTDKAIKTGDAIVWTLVDIHTDCVYAGNTVFATTDGEVEVKFDASAYNGEDYGDVMLKAYINP